MSTDWREYNAEGLSLAQEGQWAQATHAFVQALAAVEANEPSSAVTPVAKDDVRARLLLNIGQCHFHTGAFEEARQLAERSCAIRVSLYGEDSLVVARTRGDLAVILAASGHADQAMSLLERAVSAVERKRGEESAHLLVLLTNAARLLARSAPDRAAAYVARLKALMFAQQQVAHAEIFPPSAIPPHSFADVPFSSGGDDHALRSAIAQTVDLLRSTPTANIALEPNARRELRIEAESEFKSGVKSEAESQVESGDESETEIEAESEVKSGLRSEAESEVESGVESETEIEAERDGESDGKSKAEIEPAEAVSLPDDIVVLPEALNAANTTESVAERAAVEVVWEYAEPLPVEPVPHISVAVVSAPIDDALFDLVEAPPPTLSAIPSPVSAERASVNPFGFEVQYGIPSQLHESLDNPTTPLPAESPTNAPSEADAIQPPPPVRVERRAVGGVRRGSTQVVPKNRLWLIPASLAVFGGGFGAMLLYRYLSG